MKILMTAMMLSTLAFLQVGLSQPVNRAKIQQIQSDLQSVEFLSVDFEQSSFKSLRRNTTKVSGKAVFGRPTKFRWIIEQPQQEEWIYDGSKLIRFEPPQKLATRFKTQSNQAREISELVALVLDVEQLFERYQIDRLEKKETHWIMSMQPKKDTEVTKVDLEVDAKKKYVNRVRVDYQGGNYTEITFSNPSFKKLDKERFAFEAPPGVKVIDFQ